MKNVFAIAVLLLLLMIIAVSVLNRRSPHLHEEASEALRPKKDQSTNPIMARGVQIQTETQTKEPSPIQAKMDRLYATYFSNPNPGYTNILAMLGPLALYDPTTTDLYKDACTFVSLRTELAIQEQQFMANRADQVKWILNHAPKDQESQSNALARFERESPPNDVWELQLADQAIQRVFQDRFTRHHGLNGDAVVTQLSLLSLTNVGPELWIRCDETVSPYPEPPQGLYNVMRREH